MSCSTQEQLCHFARHGRRRKTSLCLRRPSKGKGFSQTCWLPFCTHLRGKTFQQDQSESHPHEAGARAELPQPHSTALFWTGFPASGRHRQDQQAHGRSLPRHAERLGTGCRGTRPSSGRVSPWGAQTPLTLSLATASVGSRAPTGDPPQNSRSAACLSPLVWAWKRRNVQLTRELVKSELSGWTT